MNQFNRKKIWLFTLLGFSVLFLSTQAYAQYDSQENNDQNNTSSHTNDLEVVSSFNIMPELTEDQASKVQEKIEEIGNTWWHVMDKYNQIADNLTTSEQIASWIMNWNTILDYLKYIVKFLSQLGLLVWTCFIIYAWYTYMVAVFNWNKAKWETIKNAIIGVIIVVGSYAIMRILTSLVWIT